MGAQGQEVDKDGINGAHQMTLEELADKLQMTSLGPGNSREWEFRIEMGRQMGLFNVNISRSKLAALPYKQFKNVKGASRKNFCYRMAQELETRVEQMLEEGEEANS